VDVAVLERAPALRQEGSAVALWSNAWRALDALGMGQLLRDDFLLLDRCVCV
jgi:2-polyprenyl-6-methoxyphenol hydroxylase-like FAD-dependent oxidoreductase